MKIITEHSTIFDYAQKNIAKKDFPQEHEKNSMKKMLSEASAYASLSDEVKISNQSRFQNYFEQFEKAMQNGASGFTEKYDELYKGIMKNSPENERDSLINMLDSAFEYSSEFYANSMSFRMMALSGVKLKAEIPSLGSSQTNKPDTSKFDDMLEKRSQISNDIKNLFSSFLDAYRSNKDYSSAWESLNSNNSNTLTMSDLDTLSKGLMKELNNMKESGDSDRDLFDKISDSNLSDYTKELLNDSVQFDKEKI